MAKKAPEPFPALQPVRDALERLYRLAVKLPVDLDNIPNNPPFEHAEAQRHKLRDWVETLRKTYGVAPPDPPILYDADNEPDPNPRLDETSLLGALLADKRVGWNEDRKAPVAARYLIGLPPRDLIWPDGNYITPDGTFIDLRHLPPLPAWMLDFEVKEVWQHGGWPELVNTIRETYLIERARALALCRWTIKALADFEESTLPKFKVQFAKNDRGNVLRALVWVTWLGYTKEQPISMTPAEFLSKLISSGKAEAQMHVRDDLTEQLPEIALYLRAMKAPPGTKIGKTKRERRKDYTIYAIDKKARERFTVLRPKADLKQT